ncbi:hypothetical protein GCM10010458_25340 [Microbacterium luteolum]
MRVRMPSTSNTIDDRSRGAVVERSETLPYPNEKESRCLAFPQREGVGALPE